MNLPFQTKYLNAIAYCPDDADKGTKRTEFKKFHSIKNTTEKQTAFAAFIKNKFPSCKHINFYCKETKRFIERIYTS